MRYCSHCGWLSVFIRDVCLICGGHIGDNGQPDADEELDTLDNPCGCGGM